MAAKAAGQSIETFSIGFEEESLNEAVYAKAVARHLGTDHTELYVTGGEAMSVIPRLPHLYDEPFADVQRRLSVRSAEEAVAAGTALLIEYTSLLAALIGEALTQRLMRNAWDYHARNDSTPENRK